MLAQTRPGLLFWRGMLEGVPDGTNSSELNGLVQAESLDHDHEDESNTRLMTSL
jgi:hypothetical protein